MKLNLYDFRTCAMLYQFSGSKKLYVIKYKHSMSIFTQTCNTSVTCPPSLLKARNSLLPEQVFHLWAIYPIVEVRQSHFKGRWNLGVELRYLKKFRTIRSCSSQGLPPHVNWNVRFCKWSINLRKLQQLVLGKLFLSELSGPLLETLCGSWQRYDPWSVGWVRRAICSRWCAEQVSFICVCKYLVFHRW